MKIEFKLTKIMDLFSLWFNLLIADIFFSCCLFFYSRVRHVKRSVDERALCASKNIIKIKIASLPSINLLPDSAEHLGKQD